MKIISYVVFVLLICDCSQVSSTQGEAVSAKEIQPELVKRLEEMVKVDTEIQAYFGAHLQDIPADVLEKKQDSVFRSNGELAKQIFKENGFPAYDIVGEAGSDNFWIVVQHSDYDIAFQEQVLAKMKEEVLQKNASPQKYAYLVDRVRKNKGLKQLYGTQITHAANMWAIPEPLEDSLSVNERRKEMGLESIEEYLNGYMSMHFDMNADFYAGKGIKSPFAYPLKE